MPIVRKILEATHHRPYEIPAARWKYYQEWNNVIFLHWKVPFELIRAHVPSSLGIDDYKGEYYISVVAFTMERIKLRYLPAVRLVSNFHEINVRTYVFNGIKKGVYFLSIEASKSISAFIARRMSGLPYEKARMNRTYSTYTSKNVLKGFSLEVDFEVLDNIESKDSLDDWLTERYCLYLEQSGSVYRYDVHHEEWPLKKIKVNRLNINYTIGKFAVSAVEPDLVHYSKGVSVVGWEKVRI